jgi:hypothetical protein
MEWRLLLVLFLVICAASCKTVYEGFNTLYSLSFCQQDKYNDVSASSGNGPRFKEAVLLYHNIHRRKHDLPLLSWDNRLASIAAAWSKQCNWFHSPYNGLGENLAQDGDPKQAVGLWYGEICQYDLDVQSAKNGAMVGHMIQMLSKHASKLGCHRTKCVNGLMKQNPDRTRVVLPGTQNRHSFVCVYQNQYEPQERINPPIDDKVKECIASATSCNTCLNKNREY